MDRAGRVAPVERRMPARQRRQEVRAGGDLAAAAKLLYEFCFQPVKLKTAKLDYEPRASCHCKEPGCAALWVASKSGSVMRIELPTRERNEPRQIEHHGDREARAILHAHDGEPFGDAAQRFLLIGRDNGVLEIVPHKDWGRAREHHRDDAGPRHRPVRAASQGEPPREPDSVPSREGFHLDTWHAQHRNEIRPVLGDGIRRDEDISPRHTVDITALAVVPRPAQPAAIDLVVATRYPWLYVIEVAGGKMQLKHRLDMPGWIQWIIGPQPDDDRLTCISRGGDIVRFTREQLEQGGRGHSTKLSLLPTAAMAFNHGSLLLGTTTGLFLVRSDRAEATAVPVTRSAVLCLASATVDSEDGPHDYITMGLENRLHVVHTDLLVALADGNERPRKRDHNFVIDMPDAVLEIQTLRPDGGAVSDAYVLAALRDHSLRLFHVISQQTQRKLVSKAWQTYLDRVPGPAGRGLADVTLDAVALWAPADCAPQAWNFMIVDEVLPELCKTAALDAGQRQRLVELACSIAGKADRRVLYRLSAAMAHLTDNQIDLLLRLSRAVLSRVPHGNDHHWTNFIDFHLRTLNALTGEPGETREPGLAGQPGKLDRADHARLVSWTRFVRKYVLLGNTFAAKQLELRDLVAQNYNTHKYLDALTYQTLLAQRCFDLRWHAQIDDEVADLCVVNCRPLPGDDAGYLLVVVVTAHGGIVFLDGASGDRVEVEDRSGRPVDGRGGQVTRAAPAPFGDARTRRHVRTLASAVASHGNRVRIVLSCTASSTRRWLTVHDVRWEGSVALPVVVEHAVQLEDDKQPRVYAVQPLPASRPSLADRFVVGLETHAHPVGLVLHDGEGWTLAPANDTEGGDGRRARGGDDPGEVPTRALAVIAPSHDRSHYLAVAGSDDGVVRAISFARDWPATEWRIKRWDRVTAGVTSVALEPHDEADAGDQPSGKLSCYLGTTAGDTFALEVLEHARSGAATTAPSPEYHAEPLWRDTHDGPVRTVRNWRGTPLYKRNDVVVAATEKGRLCVYNHAERRTDARPRDPRPHDPQSHDRRDASRPVKRVSASFNYFFRGMRFERIAISDRLRALTVIEGGEDIVAATPGGHVYRAALVYLRESDTRGDPEPDVPRELGEDLPGELWQRLHHLFGKYDHGWLDGDADRPHEPQFELFDLVRLDGSALSNYLLHRRLRFYVSRQRLRRDALRLLRSLEPEHPEHGDRIKIIIKSLCRAFLFHHPRKLHKLILDKPARLLGCHAQTARICQDVAAYLRDDLAYARRLRIAAIKELLRVTVLWHMARPERGHDIRDAVTSALDSCLRDDDRIVRFEALRALSVMLGNVAVMVALPEKRRAALLKALFPEDLNSITWLLELIRDSLQQLPAFSRRSALVGSAWYYIQALLPLFRIFPDRTLALCDYLIRAGLGLRAVGVCHQALRRPLARSRIENLYLIPIVRAQDPRDDYIERYHTDGKGHAELRKALHLEPVRRRPDSRRAWNECKWHELDDATMAERRLELLHELACMWKVTDRSDIRAIARSPSSTEDEDEDEDIAAPALRRVPLGQLEWVVNQLASVAAALADPDREVRALERLAELGKRHGSGIEGRSKLTAPIRRIVAGIVGVWRNVWEPPPLGPGMKIGGYVLGETIEEDTVFHTCEPSDTSLERVIKVVPDRKSKAIADRFLKGAELNKLLGEQSPDAQFVVPVTAIHRERPYLAYVMPKYDHVLENHLKKSFPAEPHAVLWTELAASHIGNAIRAAHALDRCHGNVKPSNILFDLDGGRPVFRLADFDLAGPADGPAGPAGLVPDGLSENARDPVATNQLAQRQWNDIAALSMILYRMLTGTKVAPDQPFDHKEHLKVLDKLARDKAIKHRRDAPRVIETLKRVFGRHHRALDINKFLTSLDANQHQPVVVLFLGANPSDTTPVALDREYDRIDERLRETAYYPLYRLEKRSHVKAEDLQQLIRDVDPKIVHFGGHGTHEGQLVFERADGTSAALEIDAVAEVFKHVRGQVRCVVLSACFSREQAEAIGQWISVVIGMDKRIPDDHAIAFSGEFYRALGRGAYVKDAFHQGRTQIRIEHPSRRGPLPARDIRAPTPSGTDEPPRPELVTPESRARLRFVEPDQVSAAARPPDGTAGSHSAP